MPVAKQTIRNGRMIHYSVGALIKQNDKYLIIYRAIPPICFAGIAGHIDEGEEPLVAIKREVSEESGLEVKNCQLLFEEMVDSNWCSKGVVGHYWYLYHCEVGGIIKQNFIETKSIGWYSIEEIKNMELESVWKYWFEKLKLLR